MANRQNKVRHIPNTQKSQTTSLMDLPPPYEHHAPQGHQPHHYPNPNPQNPYPQYPNPQNPYPQYPNPQNPYPQYPTSLPVYASFTRPPLPIFPCPPPHDSAHQGSSLPTKQPLASDRGGAHRGRGRPNTGGRGGPSRGGGRGGKKGKQEHGDSDRGTADGRTGSGRGPSEDGSQGERGRSGRNRARGGPSRGGGRGGNKGKQEHGGSDRGTADGRRGSERGPSEDGSQGGRGRSGSNRARGGPSRGGGRGGHYVKKESVGNDGGTVNVREGSGKGPVKGGNQAGGRGRGNQARGGPSGRGFRKGHNVKKAADGSERGQGEEEFEEEYTKEDAQCEEVYTEEDGQGEDEYEEEFYEEDGQGEEEFEEDDEEYEEDEQDEVEYGEDGVEDVQAAELNDNAIFHWLLKEKAGISNVRSIMSQGSLVPSGLKSEDVYHYLSECKQKFLVVRHRNDIEKSIIQVCLRNLKICPNHQAPKSCLTEDCSFLHLCQAYVGGLCKRASHCSMNHSLLEEQTLKVLKSNVVDIFPEKEQLTLIRLSSPTICPFQPYSKDSFCSMIHICTHFLEGKCLRLDSECSLGHTIITEHNVPILNGFGVVILEPKELSKHLMVVDPSVVPCMHGENSMPELETDTVKKPPSKSGKEGSAGASAGKPPPKSGKEGSAGVSAGKPPPKSGKEGSAGVSAGKPPPKSGKEGSAGVSAGKPPPKSGKEESVGAISDKSLPKSDPAGDSCQSEPQHVHKMDFEDIFQWILKFRKGSTSVLDVFKNSQLCSKLDSVEEAEVLLGKSRKLLVFKNGQICGLSIVQVYHSAVKVCFKYTNPAKGCENEECRYFHLCPDYIARNCENHAGCSFTHDLKEPHNKALLEKHNMSDMPLKFATSVIRKSAFLTCPEYNKPYSKCPKDITKDIICPRLHVCDDYLRGFCPLSAMQCPKSHTFDSPQVKAWINVLRATNLQPALLKNMTIPASPRNAALEFLDDVAAPQAETSEVAEEKVEDSEPKPAKPKTRRGKKAPNVTESTPKSNWFSTTEGYTLVVDGGSAGGQVEVHSPTPYQWQVECDGVWTNLDENNIIEERFLDHTCSEYWLLQAPQDLASATAVARISFDDMDCEMGKVRRLSVASYCVSSPSLKKEVDTQACQMIWVWYWLDEQHQWVPYGKSGTGPYQDVLEARYQVNPRSTYFFEVDDNHFFYKIDFTTMTQENVAVGTRRRVRRRPLQPGCPLPDYVQNRYFLPQNLPSKEGWSPMDTVSHSNFALVPLESDDGARKQVELLFWKEMDANEYSILNVARVQNIKLWKDYKRTKEEMRKSMTEAECKELSLFHGTPDLQTVHCICSQSFDHRMHGRHATLYGKGAYFSTSVAYSNRYTNRSSCTKHMFLAKVLVGRWTKGEQDMQRPPPIGSKMHGELYNSVVDNEADPSIYVVFENAQSYPQYLIEYQQRQHQPQRAQVTPKLPSVAKSTTAVRPRVSSQSANVVYVNPSQVNVNPPQVNVNPPEVNVNPSQVNVNPSQVNVNPPQVNVNPPQVNVNPPQVNVNPPQVNVNPPKTHTSPRHKESSKQEKCIVM